MTSDRIKNRIEIRLRDLHELKQKYISDIDICDWRRKANFKEVNKPNSNYNQNLSGSDSVILENSVELSDENDYRTQISSTIKRVKDSELSANTPEYTFIPLSDEASTNRRIIKDVFQYHWLISNTDAAIFDTISHSTTYGTWILYEWIKHTVREINEPYWKDTDWKILYKTKRIMESNIFCKRIPFANFYTNWTNMNDATEAIVIEYYDKEAYIQEKRLNPEYKNISKLKDSIAFDDMVPYAEGSDINNNEINDDTIIELDYYNIAKDEHIIVANWIEILNTPIPYMHKKLPFCVYIDQPWEDRFFWIWVFEANKQFEITKNEYRSLTIKWVKASIWFILKKEWSSLNVDQMEYWCTQVYETDDVDELKVFQNNVPIWAISALEDKVDEDLISRNQIDYKSLYLTPQESATKTQSKNETIRKWINHNIKYNSLRFYKRLWELRMSNIQLLHRMGAIKTPTEWGKIDNKWIFTPDETWSYGVSLIWSKFLEWDFLVLPIVDSMLWRSKERRRTKLAEFAQLTGNILWDDGKPVIKWNQLVKLACNEYWFDYEKLTEENVDSRRTEDIVKEVFEEWGSDINDPNYVPPEQRRQRDQVKTISGQAQINSPELSNE